MAKTWLDRIDPEKNPKAVAAAMKMKELVEAAQASYSDYQLNSAINSMEAAIEIAESLEASDALVYIRSLCGGCLLEEGRVIEALYMLAPIMKIDPSEVEPDDYFNGIMEYINVAITIPCSLQNIEKIFATAENLIGSKSGWRSMVLLMRAGLLTMQGEHTKALDFAKEAWALWEDEYPSYNKDTYLSMIINMCLEIDDIPLAKYYINEWDKQENSSPTYREAISSFLQLRVALAEGNMEKAQALSQSAVAAARQIGGEDFFTKILIEMGKNDDILEQLDFIRRLIRRPMMDLKYRYYQIIGTAHAVYAGLRIKEMGLNLAELYEPRASTEKEKEKHISKAVIFYRMAFKAGQEIDRRLECEWRQREAEKRLAIIGCHK